MNPHLLFLIPLLAFLDRFYGGSPAIRIKDHGLNKAGPLLIFPAAVLMGLTWQMGLALMLAFWLSRSLAWNTFGGDLAPHREAYVGTLARHSIAVVAFGLAIVAASVPQAFRPQLCWLLVYPVWATLLAIQLRRESNEGRDINGTVEIVRGAVLGACVVGALL